MVQNVGILGNGCSVENHLKLIMQHTYRAFSRDVMSAILASLNNEKSAILVYQISPVGVELFCN